MRIGIFILAAALCLASTVAMAQDGLRSASLPERPPDAVIPPPKVDLFRAAPDTYAPRFDRLQERSPLFLPGFIPAPAPFFPVFVPAPPWPVSRAADYGFETRGLVGYLQLQVKPASAHVYVDGWYVGSVADLRRMSTGYSLDAGSHRIELRAPGYQALAFEVRFVPDETITFRQDLQPSAPAPLPAARAPAGPKTFYVIPGCYAGDRPPAPGSLPAGCDASSLRTIPPLAHSAGPFRNR